MVSGFNWKYITHLILYWQRIRILQFVDAIDHGLYVWPGRGVVDLPLFLVYGYRINKVEIIRSLEGEVGS